MTPDILIVSNRGPKDFVWDEGRWVARPSSGGLVSMLSPLASKPTVSWFCCVSEPPDAALAQEGLFTSAADQLDAGLHVVPVPVPAPTFHAYYGRISNEVLWMLQHRVLGRGGYEYLDRGRYDAWADGYLAANRMLADAIAVSCASARAILVQDYHLYPLPALLRRKYPRAPILHFTHIPFFDVGLMKLIPPSWRETILRGLLGADVVGFQTDDDRDAFLACCAEFLHVQCDSPSASVTAADGRCVRARTYAASVDVAGLARDVRSKHVAAARARLAFDPRMKHVIRVDRLDPSKNQLIGFRAFERLLETRPDLRAHARFSAFLVPSRTDLGVYRAYRETVFACIETINNRFEKDCGGRPIQVFYTNDRDQALAAMADCDLLLVNSLEDGMNLVAKEWAMISRRPGVLVLSETTGVAAEAGDSALMISPLDIEGTARAMATALDMPPEERQHRIDRFRRRIEAWTAHDWLAAQLADLRVPAEILDLPSALPA
ncbi:MAG TPA: trehalose-6-phosphate synthase [Chloroflexota bacterium]|nr:trehalose-6-phosphate synthase [Chloroflexota bacterium]